MSKLEDHRSKAINHARELRSKGLLSWNGNEFKILDRETLAGIVLFDPAYL